MSNKRPNENGSDPRLEMLKPEPDVLLHLEVPDELLKYYLSMARASGMVYALAVKQLVNRVYRDHDYTRRRKLEGRRSGYDTVVERDQQALAWLISAAALYVPDEVKHHPIPPKPPRPRRTTPKSNKAAKSKQQQRHADTTARALAKKSSDAEMLRQAQELLDAARALRDQA